MTTAAREGAVGVTPPPLFARSHGPSPGPGRATTSTTLGRVLHSRAGLSPVMVGRDAELDALRRRLARVPAPGSAGKPPVVVVSGEAGIGKTRLLRELCADVDVAVLAAQAQEGDDAHPYALLRAVCEPVVAVWDGVPAPLAAREHVIRHTLEPLLTPPTHAYDPVAGDGHEHTSEELLRAAVEVVRHIVGDGPVLLLLEDLHWADAETIELFGRLATVAGLPALLVGTFRPEDVDRRHPLTGVLPSLERRRTVDHVALDRLSRGALAEMLEAVYDRPVPAATLHALHARTLGNPFFVEELVAGSGTADPAELPDAELPWNVAEAVLRRLDDLDPETREVLDVAAVLGARVDFDLLSAVTGRGERDLLRRLHALDREGILAEREADQFSFRHALTREAVSSELFDRERRHIHEAALHALEEAASDDYVALARHAVGAERTDALAASAVQGARRLLADGAASRALHLAELALDRCDDLAAWQETALHELASQAAWRLSLLDVAERHAEAWHWSAVAHGEPAAQSAALRHLASVRWMHGDVDGFRRALDEALATAEPLGPSAELAWCYSYRSQQHMFMRHPDEAIRWADAALALADEVGADEVRPYTLVNKGTVLAETPGREEVGLGLLAEAREEARRLEQPKALLRAYNNALVHLITERPGAIAQARQLVAEFTEAAERHGDEVYGQAVHEYTGEIALIVGDAAAAEREFGSAAAMHPGHEAKLHLFRARAAAERGDESAARAALKRADEAAEQAGEPASSPEETAFAAFQRAQVLVATGRLLGDAGLVTDALSVLRSDDVGGWADHRHRGTPLPWTHVLVDAAAVDDVDEGTLDWLLAVIEARAIVDKPVHRAALAWASTARAARRGAHDEVVARGLGGFAEGDVPVSAVLRAEVRRLLARAYAAVGERRAARAQVEAGLALLERWPGVRRDELVALSRSLGAAGDDEGAPGPLTPREREVLRLIARGHSNRGIAERLFIAQKTAAVHVSNILHKTGTSSRTEAAAWAHEHGLVGREAG